MVLINRTLFRKKLTIPGLALAAVLTFSSNAFAQSTPTELADLALEDLLNFEVTEEHTGNETDKKKWSFSYTYRKLSSDGYRSGTEDFTFQEVLFSPGETRTMQNFPVVPTFIRQNVHAFSAGYTLSEKISVNVILPYISQGTDHISSVPDFADFLLTSEGIGDVGVSASYQKRPSNLSAVQFTMGVRIPTGSIDVRGDTPRGGSGTLERLPYTMQIGSGTWDFTGAVNYSKLVDDFKIGLSANTTLRTGKNANDYRLGNNYGASAWAQHAKNHWFQPGLRLNLREIESIKGADISLLVPAAFPYPASITNPDNYGGMKANISAFVKICPKTDCNVSFSGEYGQPVYQKLNGIQPRDRRFLSASAAVKF